MSHFCHAGQDSERQTANDERPTKQRSENKVSRRSELFPIGLDCGRRRARNRLAPVVAGRPTRLEGETNRCSCIANTPIIIFARYHPILPRSTSLSDLLTPLRSLLWARWLEGPAPFRIASNSYAAAFR